MTREVSPHYQAKGVLERLNTYKGLELLQQEIELEIAKTVSRLGDHTIWILKDVAGDFSGQPAAVALAKEVEQRLRQMYSEFTRDTFDRLGWGDDTR